MNSRNADLAKIHLGAAHLGMSDDTYRAMLHSVAGVGSAAKLSPTGRAKVIDHLVRLGFKIKRKGRTTPAFGRDAQIKKIRAMLAAENRPDAYADGIARRMFKVDRFEWLAPDKLRKLIAALSYDQKRRNQRSEP